MTTSPLWKHQAEAVNKLVAKGRGLLGMDVGTGKTRAAIELIERWDCRRVLVVCPGEMVPVWPTEFAKHGFTWWTHSPQYKGSVPSRAANIVDAVMLAPRHLAVEVSYAVVADKPMQAAIARLHPDCIVLDESHFAKGVGSQVSRYLGRLGRVAPHVIGMTGTPIHDKPIDLYGQFRCIAPNALGANFEAFRSRYFITDADHLLSEAHEHAEKQLAKMRGPITPKDEDRFVDAFGTHILKRARADVIEDREGLLRLIGAAYVTWRLKRAPFMRSTIHSMRDPDALIQAIEPWTYTCRKRDVLDNLPPVVHETRSFSLGPETEKAYRAIIDGMQAEVEGGTITAANILSKSIRLRQIINGIAAVEDGTRTIIGNERSDALAGILKELPQDEQVAVFGVFHEDFDAIHRAAKSVGRTSAELTGREKELERWRSGEANVLVVHPKTGGAGLDFTQACCQIYYAHDWSLGDYEQTLGRMDRPGQHNSVTYIHLQADGTVDEDVVRCLQEKGDIAGYFMSGLRNARTAAGEQAM